MQLKNKKVQQTDFLIIGAGIVGISAYYYHPDSFRAKCKGLEIKN